MRWSEIPVFWNMVCHLVLQEKDLSHNSLITLHQPKTDILARDGPNGWFIWASRTKMLNPGDWKSDITSNIFTETNGEKYSSLRGMEEMQAFQASSFWFKVLKQEFLQVEKLAIFTTKELDLQGDAGLLRFYLAQNYFIEEDFYQM